MIRTSLKIRNLLLVASIIFLSVSSAEGYSGAGSIWYQPKGAFIPANAPGDTAGFGVARDRCIARGGGVIQLGPGLEGLTLNYPTNAGLLVLKSFTTGWQADPWSLGASDSGVVYAIGQTSLIPKYFAGTGVGIHQALAYLGSKGGGFLQLGPGQYLVDSSLTVYGNITINGSGKGVTTLKRNTLNLTGPQYYGNIFISGKYGSANIMSIARADSQSNINISNLTLDGNYSAFGTGVSPGTPGHMGIWFIWTRNITIDNIEIKNFLMTGIQFDTCGNAKVTNSWIHDCGQVAVPSSRNGVNFINNQAGSYPYASDCIIDHCTLERFNDTAVNFSNTQYCTFSNSTVVNSLTDTIEIENNASLSTTTRYITISNIRSIDGGYYFCVLPAQNGVTISDVNISNCTYTVPSGTGTSVRAAALLFCTSTSTGFVKRVNLSNSRISWANIDTTYSGGTAINLTGNVSDVKVTDCYIENVPGQGITITNSGSAAYNISDIDITRLTVNKSVSHAFGISVFGDFAATTRRVKFYQCTTVDPCYANVGADAAFNVVQSFNNAGAAIQDLTIEACNMYRVSGRGTANHGIRLFQAGSGILDRVNLIDNNFSSAIIGPISYPGGTPTNVFSTFSRIGSYSTGTSGGAIRVVDGITFPITLLGIQAALDEVEASGGGEVHIPTNANIVLTTVPLKVPNRVHLIGTGAYTTLPTFTANASTNVVAAIMPKDTTGTQQYMYVEHIQITGNKGSGAWIGAGILVKGIYVGSRIKDNLIVSVKGNGLKVDGGTVGVGQMLIDNNSIAACDDDNVKVTGAADHIQFIQLTSEIPATGKAAVRIECGGCATANSRGILSGVHMEGTNVSDGIILDQVSDYILDGIVYDGANFNSVIKITGTGTGSDGAFGAAGHTIRNVHGNIATIIDDQSAGVTIGNGGSRFVDFYRSPVTADGRITGQIVGLQPSRIAPSIVSAATITFTNVGSGANIFSITGTNTSTDVTFTDAYIGRLVAFRTAAAWPITSGNHWKLNGNFTGNATGNDDMLFGYVDASKNFIEISRVQP